MQGRRVGFDNVVEKSYWIWRANPLIMVPTMLSNALQVVIQGAAYAILIVTISKLVLLDVIQNLVGRVVKGDLSTLLTVLKDSSVLSVIIPAAAAIMISVVVISVVGGGIVASAEYGIYSEVILSGKVTLKQMIHHLSSKWKKMAWSTLLVALMTYGPFLLGLLLIYQIVFVNSDVGLFSILAVFVTLTVGLIIALIVAIGTVYVFPVVALDGASGFKAITKSFAVARRSFGITGTYVLVRLFSQLILVGIVFAGNLVGAPIGSLVSVILGLFLIPILHLTKTRVYQGQEESLLTIAPSILSDLRAYIPAVVWSKLKAGLVELKGFVLDIRNIPFHALSAASLVVGVKVGLDISRNGLSSLILTLGYGTGKINPQLTGLLPPFLGLDLFLHNWQISLVTALSGIFLLVPVPLTLFSNGFILGVVQDITPNETMFLAAILPHGIIEIPAFLLAGSCGIKLGFTAVKALVSGDSDGHEELCVALRQAIYIALGLIPLFIIAGLVESMVTPAVMRMYGWK